MNKRLKRIYIEIMNVCNLKCSFCVPTRRYDKIMNIEQFEYILKQIDEYCDYVYLHVKGEPIMHPKLQEILDLCLKYNKRVQLVTNGILLLKKRDILLKHNSIRRISISLHGLIEEKNYLEHFNNIMQYVHNPERNSDQIIQFRFWTSDDDSTRIQQCALISKLESEYNCKITIGEDAKLADNIYISFDKKFVWPDLNNKFTGLKKTCVGPKMMMAILADGTVTPCCLDHNGIINLGNIYTTSFTEIYESDRLQCIMSGFRDNKAIEELCQHCEC